MDENLDLMMKEWGFPYANINLVGGENGYLTYSTLESGGGLTVDFKLEPDNNYVGVNIGPSIMERINLSDLELLIFLKEFFNN